MANWKGHVAGAVVVGGAYAGAVSFAPVERFAEMAGVLHDWQALAAVLVLAVLFGLFPDIDTNSKGQNIFYGLALGTDILLIWSGNIQAAAYLGLVAMLLIPLPILLIPYLYNQAMLQIGLVYYGAAVAGYFSHLLLDGLIWKHFRIKT